MEWLLAVGALVALLVYISAKQSRVESREPALGNDRRLALRAEPSMQFGKRDSNIWSDPRSDPDPRFEGPNQWERVHREEPLSRSINGTPARWVANGETVQVGGIQISSGMFYLGTNLKSVQRGVTENCLIVPSLKVASSGGDPAGQKMPYWPSYSNIDPVARRTFLQWLAGGRTDPSISIGYVFLFFYGLERRLFLDGANGQANAIVAEVERLLAIYGSNNSFRGYATRFIEAAASLSGSDIARPALSPSLRSGYEISIPVRLYLGRKLKENLPFDGKDALLWVLALPDTYLRTAATRCFDEFVELWGIRFLERYPDGLKINAPKARLKLEYRAASSTFHRKLAVGDGSGPLPDIAAVSAPLDGLRDLVAACADELGAYSRLLGKTPEAKGTVEAAFLLPRELLLSSSFALGSVAIGRIEALFENRTIAQISVGQLIAALGIAGGGIGKMPSGTCNQIGAFLDKIDIAFEPDRRYGSRNLTTEGHVLLFKAKAGAPVDSEKDAYVSAKAMIDVATLAAAADGEIAAAEYQGIKADIHGFPELSGVERARLIAYSNTLLRDAPGQQLAMQRLKRLPAEERAKAVRSAMSAVLADGHATPQEVKFLEKLQKTLGFPVEDVYSALHRRSVAVDEPVMVAVAEAQSGIPIPKEQVQTPGLKFDAARLQRIRSETSAVSELLAEIFVEEASAVTAPPRAVPEVGGNILFKGLDPAHGELLASILVSGTMDRSALEGRARSLRLLPEGAIETINEWGFETFEEPIIEGEDPVSVLDHLRTELLKLKAAA
ncbi:MAG: hypothetical protein EOR67_28235 [Mesorhizobium sp.]|uniref:tellurite resistance TerB family protein n=1 Tax=Mesorhizobium sp. TaxID=1871066 RepID=UPI000FE49C17|nr:TerB N-terminal domain-containing protein [Mesorhizobium sp.]RWL81985.1 MAG: hypothetical protein EOR67_28235 [Mesorhizobium sp.]